MAKKKQENIQEVPEEKKDKARNYIKRKFGVKEGLTKKKTIRFKELTKVEDETNRKKMKKRAIFTKTLKHLANKKIREEKEKEHKTVRKRSEKKVSKPKVVKERKIEEKKVEEKPKVEEKKVEETKVEEPKTEENKIIEINKKVYDKVKELQSKIKTLDHSSRDIHDSIYYELKLKDFDIYDVLKNSGEKVKNFPAFFNSWNRKEWNLIQKLDKLLSKAHKKLLEENEKEKALRLSLNYNAIKDKILYDNYRKYKQEKGFGNYDDGLKDDNYWNLDKSEVDFVLKAGKYKLKKEENKEEHKTEEPKQEEKKVAKDIYGFETKTETPKETSKDYYGFEKAKKEKIEEIENMFNKNKEIARQRIEEYVSQHPEESEKMWGMFESDNKESEKRKEEAKERAIKKLKDYYGF